MAGGHIFASCGSCHTGDSSVELRHSDMMLCTGCYEIQELGKQLEDEAGEENLNEMYEQDADDELECRHDEGNVSDAMAVHPEDEEHVDDESTYPTTEESVVIKHNSDTSELCRKCRRKVVNVLEVTTGNVEGLQKMKLKKKSFDRTDGNVCFAIQLTRTVLYVH